MPAPVKSPSPAMLQPLESVPIAPPPITLAIHQPFRERAVGVPQNVGLTVAVEIADPGDAPAGAQSARLAPPVTPVPFIRHCARFVVPSPLA